MKTKLETWNKNVTIYTGRNFQNFVMLEIIKDGEYSSWEIASNFDNYSNGRFCYRDWTKDGLPFVDSGDVYWSGFWFEHFSDAKKFVTLYGGSGNWMKHHEKFVQECNQKRGY